MCAVVHGGERVAVGVQALVVAALLGDLAPLGAGGWGAGHGLAHGGLAPVAAAHVARVMLERVEVLAVRDRLPLPVRARQVRQR